MQIYKFTTKLNKLDNNIYSIEEEVNVVNGKYKGFLEHDNVNINSLNVYTGSKLTGEKINSYILSTPSETPWKTEIELYTKLDTVYITYETVGDTIEAEDINILQDSIVYVQEEFNKYQKSNDNKVSELVENKINGVAFDGTRNITIQDSTKVTPTGTIVANRIPIFSDATGKVIKDSGFTIATSVPSGAKFTDTVYTHPTSAGNKHIPSGGATGQILKWYADGTAVWGAETNTWRGVQDNLTSTATNQSLSANQGRVLKGMIDGKANSSHNHTKSQISDFPTKLSQFEDDLGIGQLPSQFTWNMLKGV